MNKPDPTEARLRFDERWTPEPMSGCYLWTGPIDAKGYGLFYLGSVQWRAHRLAWLWSKGEIPSGMLVCHCCDIPSCVNPSHLFMGTHSDNMKDCTRKGRQRLQKHPEQSIFNGHQFVRARGEQIGSAKLTEDQVREVRRLRGLGLKRIEIASRFGISDALVYQIFTRKIWKHI